MAKDNTIIEVEIGGQTVRLLPSDESIRRAVITAYLIGGFDLVVSLHRQVEYRKNMEEKGLEMIQTQLSAQKSMRQDNKPKSISIDWDKLIRESVAEIAPREQRVRIAKQVEQFIRQSWADIAGAEEQVLREYEPEAIAQFFTLTKEAKDICLKEWKRYEPYDPKAQDTSPLDIAQAKERGTQNLRIKNERDGLVNAIHDLHDAWKKYLDSLHGTQTIAGFGSRRLKANEPDKDPAEILQQSQGFTSRLFAKFDKLRTDIGEKFPVALQVYGKLGSQALSTLRTDDRNQMIESWVIDTLIKAVESATKIAEEAIRLAVFKPGIRLRIEPDRIDELWDNSIGMPKIPVYQYDLLKKRLVIPASRVIATALSDRQIAIKSAWAQLPVRNKLYEMGTQGKPNKFTPYTIPGRLHHAALTEIHALQEVREKQQAEDDRALLVIDAIAVPLAFFTEGGSLVFAGVVHAIVQGREMGISLLEYQAQDKLAGIALTPLQQCIWEHPSAVKLAANLLEGGFEISTALITGGKAGAVLDAIQISLAITYGAQAVVEWASSEAPLDK